ncbi:MAG: Na+/H+ antiporter NhaA [Deltaproteobacteria bacterium]|nr:MAG: Na+/H+ antiporter NhaA [Deltaproteobacteria bacterium]
MSQTNEKSASFFRISQFIKQETLGGILLILATIIAVIWANSSFYEGYNYMLHGVKFGISHADFNMSLHHWVNDGLMALFFFTIGLEIKREVMGGELSSVKKAALPVMAAIGGMLIPAFIYILFTANNPDYSLGWGIPMATDIAFALGILALLGSRVNINLKIFLTALAIADDLGAILVIAIFYTDTINYLQIGIAFAAIIILIAGNRMGIRSTFFYGFIGLIGVWLAFIFSGIHATIAGVLIALTIPAKAKISETEFVSTLSKLVSQFGKEKINDSKLLTKEQAHLIGKIEMLSNDAHTPLQRLEHILHPISAFIVIPVFALFNAGVRIEGNIVTMIFHPVSLGIIAGLVLGKFLGISIFSHLIVKMKVAVLPEGVNFRDIYGVALLAGIGFTMSIFISDLAFSDQQLVQVAKVGIFTASIIAAVLGVIILTAGKDPGK